MKKIAPNLFDNDSTSFEDMQIEARMRRSSALAGAIPARCMRPTPKKPKIYRLELDEEKTDTDPGK